MEPADCDVVQGLGDWDAGTGTLRSGLRHSFVQSDMLD